MHIPKKEKSSRTWCLDNWISNAKEKKTGTQLHPILKNQLKMVRNLNVKVQTIKLSEENLGVDPYNLGLGNGIFDMTPRHK